jgi:pimeloyl-ACP methyl ester carboxylesterase
MRRFEVDWQQDDVDRVLARVAATRLPDAPESAGWSLGCDNAFLERFRDHWLGQFDLERTLAHLNAFAQYIAEIDGLEIHFVHVRGEGDGAGLPLLLTHGWPGSHFEFFACVDRLAFPSRYGGCAEDALDLIIPSLPGYGFSSAPDQPIGPRTTARLWNRLMTEVLGYDRYLAQGGDWGSLVTTWLGIDHAASVAAIHLNMLPLHPGSAEAATAQAVLGAYAALQMTRPHSLALAAADNPLGQAAWILERFHDWTMLGDQPLDEVFGMDHLVTNVMLYVMTGRFASSLWFYNGLIREGVALLSTMRCEAPTAYAAFPGDKLMPVPPRSLAEERYAITRWSPMPRGGHFAAMEEPELFAADVAGWAREIRTR